MKFFNQYSCGYNPIQENNDTNKTKFRGLKPNNPQEKLNIKLSLQSLEAGPPKGAATGAIFPGPHSARGPILTNVTSIMQKCFQP